MPEKTSEGFKPSGQAPDAKATDEQRARSLRDEDPQAYELFMKELREAFGLPESEAKTVADVAALMPSTLRVAQANVETNVTSVLAKDLIGLQEEILGEIDRYTAPEKVQQAALAKVAQLKKAQQTESAVKSGPVSEFLDKLVAGSDMSGPSAFEILRVCMELAIFLIAKNRQYGDSALDPVRIMSSADPVEQIKVRMDDKLSRLYRGHMGGEDAMQDLVGYWVLLRVAEKKAADKEK